MSAQSLFRRQVLAAGVAVALPRIGRSAAPAMPNRLPVLRLSGPAGVVSMPLMRAAEEGELTDLAERVEFHLWRDPDQLRALTMDDRVDVVAMPTNVAANFHNRGAPVGLLNVSTRGILWLVSRSAERRTLTDFRGEEIAVPFRGDMPDIVLQLLAARHGMDARRDFRLRYVPTPMEAMQLLLTRRVDHALLAEPAASMALRRTRSFPVSLVAPELHRSVDLQQEWARMAPKPTRLLQAGIALVGKARHNAALRDRLQTICSRSTAWCSKEVLACGRLVARHAEQLMPEAVSDSIGQGRLDAAPAAHVREELEFFLLQLLKANPALVGGKLPGDGFYIS